MRARRTVALLGDDPDWHARQLTAALAARGIDCRWRSLRECAFTTGEGGPDGGVRGLRIPGFESELPDGVLVRLLSAGSLEQITIRLGILHALEALGVPVCNDAGALERTVDKSMTSFLLQRAGLPTPPTWTAESRDLAAAILARETAAGERLVLKPVFGCQGKGLQLLDAGSPLPEPEEVGGVYYLQRYTDTGDGRWHDCRVFVAGGRAVAAMIRRGKGWITNVRQGGRCEPISPDGALGEMAVAAVRAVDAAYAGVDLIRDGDGRYLVLEVNSVPAWKGLQGVTDVNIADAIVEDFVTRLPAAGPHLAAV